MAVPAARTEATVITTRANVTLFILLAFPVDSRQCEV